MSQRFFLVSFVLLAGCSDDSGPIICQLGQTQICHCTAEQQGVQLCEDAGRRWGVCRCDFTDGGVDSDQGPRPDAGYGLGSGCAEDNDCASGHCTDERCCTVDTCGACKTCTGEAGTCEDISGDEPHAGDCPGDVSCGAGQCSDGECAYLASGTECHWLCDTAVSGGQLAIHTCDGSGDCSDDPTNDKDCVFSLCAGSPADCAGHCIDHEDCVADSVCDRSQAHAQGVGTCVDPDKVLSVSSVAALVSALSNLGNTTHVKLAAGTYERTLSITTPVPVTLVGSGETILTKTGATFYGPVLTISGGAQVTLQGVTVLGGSDGSTIEQQGDGLQCGGSTSKLTVVESFIENNEGYGIESSLCTVTLRRSTVEDCDLGGLKLVDGTFVLTNNLIRANGSDASDFGGVSIPTATSVTFVNNTVTGNQSKQSSVEGVAGVLCPGATATNVVNSIIWSNAFGHAHKNCITTTSTTTNPNFLDYVPQDPSAVDKGENAYVEHLKLDRANLPRIVGDKVDMGCYEKQN